MNTPGRLGLKLEHLNFIVPLFSEEGDISSGGQQGQVSPRGEKNPGDASENFSKQFGF